jgi:cytidylate kinase
VVAVAVSGPDNVGKSTQIRLLAREAGVTEAAPLDAHDPRWAGAHAQGLADWWFRRAALEEVVDVLACSYLARSAAACSDDEVRLVDRGIAMLEATVVATAAVRERLSYQAAVPRAGELLAAYQADLERAEAGEWAVLLLHAEDPAAGTERALARERQVSPVYAAYQRVLNDHLHALAAAGRFAEIIVVGDRPILEVQHELRVLVCDRLGVPVPGLALHQVQVVALGGLSESGKSTAGAYLAARQGYARLKIGYLLEAAAARCGVADVYALDEAAIAEMLALGLETYCAAHHFQRQVSIESLHRAGMTAELAKLLGDRLMVVYLDASPAIRELRSLAGAADVRERDVVKRSRGAERIREFADVVIGNNGSRMALYRALDRIAASHRWPRAAPHQMTVADLRLPPRLAGYLDALLARVADPALPLVSLLAVTGSGARGKYQQGWSDLDVLAVAGQDNLSHLRAVLAELAGQLGAVKLGFTIVSAAECAAGAVTPRLLHTLALIGAGRLPVLWHADSLMLPCPDHEADAFASLGDGVAAAIEIRRQLVKPTLDLRSLYKVTALVAKVALRAEGEEHPGDTEALHALMGRFPASFAGFDPGVVTAARHDEQAAIQLAHAVLAWWLTTLPAVRQGPLP